MLLLLLALLALTCCCPLSTAAATVQQQSNAGGRPHTTSNYLCKNASSDWPLPCVAPKSRYTHANGSYTGIRRFPISAWAGPVGYGSVNGTAADNRTELQWYAEAGFTIVQLSDRTAAHATFGESWAFLQRQLRQSAELGLQVFMDTYTPITRPWNDLFGGFYKGKANTFVNKTKLGGNHRITLPELQWLAQEMRTNYSHVVGLLITDDGTDLSLNEVEEAQWMVKHTPELIPWLNQCGGGSEWWARAGVPLEVPEIYYCQLSGDAVGMARNQLGGYDEVRDESNRFGFVPWPLFNVGDASAPEAAGDAAVASSVDVGAAVGSGFMRLESISLTRFQPYAALAHGFKGLMWYCWLHGIWTQTLGKPGPLYPIVTEVNTNAVAWGDTLLEFDEHHAVFHTGWSGPVGGDSGTVSITPAPGAVVEAMTNDTLVGLMTSSFRAQQGDEHTALAIIVDKTVSHNASDPPPRWITVAFSGQLVKNATVLPSPGSDSHAADVHRDSTSGQVRVTVALKQGQGTAVLLHAHAPALSTTPTMMTLRRELMKLRPWRVRNASRVSLRDWSTNQYDTYQAAYRQPTQTEMAIGWSSPLPLVQLTKTRGRHAADTLDTETFVESLGSCAFNAVVGQAPVGVMVDHGAETAWRDMLNAGMRQGLAVLADVTAAASASTASQNLIQTMASIQADYGCHPSFGGYKVPALPAAVDFVRESAPHLFAITPVSSAADLAAAVDPAGLRAITPALRIPAQPGFHFANETDRGAAVITKLVQMRGEVVRLTEHTNISFSPWVELDVCGVAATPGVLRLQAFAAVCYGAQAVFHGDFSASTTVDSSRPTADAQCTPSWPLLRSINTRLADWGDMLLRQSILAIFSHRVASDDAVTKLPAPGELVVGLDQGVHVTVLSPLADKDPTYGWMQAEKTKGPPALLVLNGKVGEGGGAGGGSDQRSIVTVELDSSVVGYAPFERDCAAGTSDACQVMVIGSTLRLELLPGEAEYVQLVMAI